MSIPVEGRYLRTQYRTSMPMPTQKTLMDFNEKQVRSIIIYGAAEIRTFSFDPPLQLGDGETLALVIKNSKNSNAESVSKIIQENPQKIIETDRVDVMINNLGEKNKEMVRDKLSHF